HSKGTRLSIEMIYDRNMQLRIVDDGCGIDLHTLQNGREGHYGLTGMRERAARIGARLEFSSSDKGTLVTLVVPGNTIFESRSVGGFWCALKPFRRSKSRQN